MSTAVTQALDWLRLASVPGIGPVLGRRVAGALGGPARALSATSRELRALGVPAAVVEAMAHSGADMPLAVEQWLAAAPRRHVIGLDSAHYPARLRELGDAPLALLLEGEPSLLASPQLAMVGSRNPSAGGADTAHRFAAALARVGLVITSGLARGIDAASHRGALHARAPTVAVLGHGPDRIYPEQHAELARAIVDGDGALITEFVPGVAPERANFPRRNRIISGLSLGVLVVEAAVRSGSLITARQALEQGREVFAVPGSIHNPMARGCHRLIRDGAKLVETTDDVLEELAPQLGAELSRSSTPTLTADPPASCDLDDDYVTVLTAMGHDPVSVDALVQRTGLTPQALSSMLIRLELQGRIRPVSGIGYERVVARE